jgi:hypothetical protein
VCIVELVGKDSWFLTMKIIKENMYSHGGVKISSLLKRFLHIYIYIYIYIYMNGCMCVCLIADWDK